MFWWLPATPSRLGIAPESLKFADAGTIPIVGGTSLQCLLCLQRPSSSPSPSPSPSISAAAASAGAAGAVAGAETGGSVRRVENMTLYGPRGKCHPDNDPKSYLIPVDQCFSPGVLFPGDPQWGSSDTLDSCNKTHITRRFFGTSDGSCKGAYRLFKGPAPAAPSWQPT